MPTLISFIFLSLLFGAQAQADLASLAYADINNHDRLNILYVKCDNNLLTEDIEKSFDDFSQSDFTGKMSVLSQGEFHKLAAYLPNNYRPVWSYLIHKSVDCDFSTLIPQKD